MNNMTFYKYKVHWWYSDEKEDFVDEGFIAATSYANAVKQLEEAARAGHGKAALFLAELYYQGFRVERDSLKAQYWQNMATMKA